MILTLLQNGALIASYFPEGAESLGVRYHQGYLRRESSVAFGPVPSSADTEASTTGWQGPPLARWASWHFLRGVPHSIQSPGGPALRMARAGSVRRHRGVSATYL